MAFLAHCPCASDLNWLNINDELNFQLFSSFSGRIPLHYAVSHGSNYSIEILILSNPSLLDVTDSRGETPRELASKLGSADVLNAITKSVNMVLPKTVQGWNLSKSRKISS